MADNTTKVIDGNGTAEQVAYDLMTLIRYEAGSQAPQGREAILDLYAECLDAAKGRRNLRSMTPTQAQYGQR